MLLLHMVWLIAVAICLILIQFGKYYNMITFIMNCFEFIAHLDVHLQQLILNAGSWVYLILFFIIFCETGLIIFPFLPGDSLLFAAGSLAAVSSLNVHLLVIILFLAAVGGDNFNYWVGRQLGLRYFKNPKSRWLNPAHLEKTHAFYEKYGPKAIIMARFVPIIRTFMPFTAGLAHMTYRRYLSFDIIGGLLWVGGITYIGYFFGNISWVKNNFSIAIFGIIALSLLPAVWEIFRNYRGLLRIR